MKPYCPVQFGTNVRRLRERRNLSQHALAQLASIPQSSLCRIESGKRDAKSGQAYNIKVALICDWEELYNMN